MNAGLDHDVSKKREREEEEDDEEAKQKELDDAFLNACRKQSLNDVKRTLNAGASINAQNVNGNSALICACLREEYSREGTLEIVKFLLSKRCSPALVNKKGQNTLHVAASVCSSEVMKLLLSKEPHLSQVKTIKGETPLGYVCQYRFDDDAVRIAELLVDTGADIEQACTHWTPLLLACRCGRSDLVVAVAERSKHQSCHGNR